MLTENKIEKDEFEELKAAARPLQDYLFKKYHIHCTAIVSLKNIEILEAQIFMPTEDWLKQLYASVPD